VSASAFDRLQRVLDLEERQGWRNRAVIGGLHAMAARWQKDAADEAADPAIVAGVVALMKRYQTAAVEGRSEIAATIRRALAGEPIEYPEVQAAVVEEVPPVQAEAVPAKPDRSRPVYTSDPEELSEPVAAALPPPEPTHVARAKARRQQATRQRNADALLQPVTAVAGVGASTAELLAKLEIHRIIDLIWHLPARHDDFSQLRTIAQLRPGDQVTVIANVWDVRERKISMQRQMIQGILQDGTGTLQASWWNKYVRNQLKVGSTLRFSGKVGLYMGKLTLESPAFEELDEEMVATGRLSPVYPLTEGLTNKKLRAIVKSALDDYGDLVGDPVPESVLEDHDLPGLSGALRQVHFPEDQAELADGWRRLAFDELLYIQLGAQLRRRELKQAAALALPGDEEVRAAFAAKLPFALTGAQQRVLDETLADLERTVPMTRLVQGDVGSGKTAIAAAAMLVAARNDTQSVLLAPTQILAEQHHRSLARLLAEHTRSDGTPLNLALLTGRVSGAAREEVLGGLSDGTIDIVVGTTALIQDAVEFARLGLVVVDEQHRFGVEQRGALRNRAETQPHLLVMSATPIPRSLALTLFGDLDLSVIDEMPPGRTPIKTKWFSPMERERVYGFIRAEAQAGRQAFIVYPLVEESEKLDAGAAVEAHARLQQDVFPDLHVALLHGRMSGQEKDEVMQAFAAGDYHVLVSTTVIEVGIDVPNASVILIEDAERFGLAQLHQLRGRVGRGAHKSYCALVSKAEGGEAAERLHALETMVSGFDLAEKDLELRGPGDFLGTRQSGLPDLRVAQLGDMPTLLAARDAAVSLIAQDPTLVSFPQLARQVERFWRGHGDIS
jgi:ATP-dependent DNA helicase RecG